MILDHLQQAFSYLDSHIITWMDGTGDSTVFPVLTGIVEADQGVIFRDGLSGLLKKPQDRLQDHVVAADDGGTLRKTFKEFANLLVKAVGMGLVGNTPFNVVVFKF